MTNYLTSCYVSISKCPRSYFKLRYAVCSAEIGWVMACLQYSELYSVPAVPLLLQITRPHCNNTELRPR